MAILTDGCWSCTIVHYTYGTGHVRWCSSLQFTRRHRHRSCSLPLSHFPLFTSKWSFRGYERPDCLRKCVPSGAPLQEMGQGANMLTTSKSFHQTYIQRSVLGGLLSVWKVKSCDRVVLSFSSAVAMWQWERINNRFIFIPIAPTNQREFVWICQPRPRHFRACLYMSSRVHTFGFVFV